MAASAHCSDPLPGLVVARLKRELSTHQMLKQDWDRATASARENARENLAILDHQIDTIQEALVGVLDPEECAAGILRTLERNFTKPSTFITRVYCVNPCVYAAVARLWPISSSNLHGALIDVPGWDCFIDLYHPIDIDQLAERDIYANRSYYIVPEGFEANQEALYARLRDGGTGIEEALACVADTLRSSERARPAPHLNLSRPVPKSAPGFPSS